MGKRWLRKTLQSENAGGREHRKIIEKLIYKHINERQQMTTGGAHRWGGEGGHSKRPTSASRRCPEHWPLCRGFFCTRLLFGCPIIFRRSLILLHWLQGESREVRWLGWSWLSGIVLTDTQNFRRARQKTAQRSFWGKGRSPKPWVLCNLFRHSVLCCSCSFQRQMYPSEVRYFACVTALLCPFQKKVNTLTDEVGIWTQPSHLKRVSNPSSDGLSLVCLASWGAYQDVGLCGYSADSSCIHLDFEDVGLFLMRCWRVNSHVLCGNQSSFCTSHRS